MRINKHLCATATVDPMTNFFSDLVSVHKYVGLVLAKQILALCQNMINMDVFPQTWTALYHNVEILWMILFMFGTVIRCYTK